jgi:galactokinase
MLLDCATRAIRQVPFRPAAAGAVALLIDTRVPHALVSGDYARRRAECEEAARQLGVPFLSQITDPAEIAGKLDDPVLERRARHVISDSARARAIASALAVGGTSGTYRHIGELLTQSHASSRDDFEISWPQADAAVEAAIAAGAYGAKMIGGGFGGSVLALVPQARAAAVRSAVTTAFDEREWRAPEFLEAIPSAAARQIG